MEKEKLQDKSQEELEDLLAKNKEKYQEVEEEKQFVLSQSGRHIPGTLRRDYKIELNQLAEKIELLEEMLAAKKN